MIERRFIIGLICIIIGLSLSACGKKPGTLRPPLDEKGQTFLNPYPAKNDNL
jgi:hypothetical protein